VQAVLGFHLEGSRTALRAGHAAADADAWIVHGQENALTRRVAQKLPGQRQNGRLLRADGQHAPLFAVILKSIEKASRGTVVEDRFEQCVTNLRQARGDALGA
jgi:hypothetical protein